MTNTRQRQVTLVSHHSFHLFVNICHVHSRVKLDASLSRDVCGPR